MQDTQLTSPFNPGLLDALLPAQPPAFLAMNSDCSDFIEHPDYGPGVMASPLMALVNSGNEGFTVPWEEAWPFVRTVIEKTSNRRNHQHGPWLDRLRASVHATRRHAGAIALADEPLPIYAAMTSDIALSISNLSLGPLLSIIPDCAVEMARTGGKRKGWRTVPWNEAWPEVREYLIHNYTDQLELCWGRELIEHQQGHN